jgi:hypothetical protein
VKEIAVKEATMRSTELHQIVFDSTGKFEKLSHFHDKVKKVLINHLDRILSSAQKRDNGQIEYYNLTEIQANMVMASIDVNHLEDVSKVFVHVKNHGYSQPVPAISTDVELKKLEVQLELAKLNQTTELAKEHTKQLEIEAKVKLGKKKTDIRRIPNCPNNFITMKAFERSLEDAGEPIPISFLKGILRSYATSINMRGNCIHEEQFNEVLDDVFANLVEEGAYMKDKQSGLRVASRKISWYDF